ncbi:MAG: type II secretion system F family protein [Pirellulaceae bacterium]|jgi:type II secretory pathway component PulF|nr:type II secretion system F family protein [Pirellulaceae bacterium]
MPNFSYVARDRQGQKITGTLTAATERDVINLLTGRALFPVSIDAERPSAAVSLGGGVSPQRMATFYSQLASLLKNGVPLLRSLAILREQSSSQAMQNALDDVISKVEDGETLGNAFARHPKVFNEMAVNMTRAGGEGGFLDEVLERIALFTEQQSELKSRTVGALIYPTVLATAGTLVVSLLLIFVVPRFDEMFNELRRQGSLPYSTDLLLAFSKWLNRYWWIIFAILAILFLLVRIQLNSPQGRVLADRIKLKLPLFGGIFQNLAVARFCRILGTLLKNGVPILKSLDISREAAGNKVLSEAIAGATDNITAGQALSEPLAQSGRFPKNVTEMIAVAEESNTLDTVLVGIAVDLEKETTRRLDLMVKLLEPLLLLIMAGIILFVVMALLLPIMKMSSALKP